MVVVFWKLICINSCEFASNCRNKHEEPSGVNQYMKQYILLEIELTLASSWFL